MLFCLAYYLIAALSLGFGISLLWLWLFCAGFFALWWGYLFLTRKGLLPPLPVWARRLAKALLTLIITLFLLVEGGIIWGMCQSSDEQADCVIIFGAAVHGEVPSLALHTRLERAYDYLQHNTSCYIICSGGQGAGESISEAEAMHRYLAARGISEERLIMEDSSTSTAENLRLSLNFAAAKGESIMLISGNYHIFRTLLLARSLAPEFTYYTAAAPYPNPLLLHYMLREAAVIVVEIWRGNLL